jgi:pyruvate dehydrogenase E2 component (dihydrolipoamide acetyltransferase)
MPVEVQMPKLGLTMEEGTILEWLKDRGDAVKKGEPLFVLETDKLTLEAEAPESGTLGQILVAAGTTVPTGMPVGLILLHGEDPALPSLPAEWQGEGQEKEKGEIKATPVARRLARRAGMELGAIEGTGPDGRVTTKDVERAMAQSHREGAGIPTCSTPIDIPTAHDEASSSVKASPRARELAQKAGLNLANVEGTGRDGRIMASDVERALADAREMTGTTDESPEAPTDQHLAPGPATPKADKSIRLSGVRGVIARNMLASAQTTAATTTVTEADATELVLFRQTLLNEWKTQLGLAPSYNDLLLVILTKALGEYPYMNAHLLGEEIRQFASINIGLAVDTARGLVVPVIKGMENMMLADVCRATQDLVQRARRGKLLPDDLSGGTFTLSNMGSFDVGALTPIINVPECGILGVGRIAARPAVFEGELCVRQTVTLSLTYDHRAIDGAPAARFLERLKHLVERPHAALLR